MRPHAVIRALAMLAFAAQLVAAPALGQSAPDDAAIEDYLARNPQAVEQIVENFLLDNPEVIEAAIAVLVQRRQDTAQALAAEAIAQHADLLFHSAADIDLGNPDGDVTLVEFYDYNCSYCRQTLADVVSLLETDTNLRVVFKQLPILGTSSIEAARVGMGVAWQDPSGALYRAFHETLLTARGTVDKARAMEAARAVGADMARLEIDYSATATLRAIEEASTLASALGLTGTPSFVVGDRIIRGAPGLAALQDHIAAVRQMN